MNSSVVLEHCDELAVSLSVPVRKIHAKNVKMILNGYFHLQKIEGLREFVHIMHCIYCDEKEDTYFVR